MVARPNSGRDQRVCVAQIGAAHGLKGEVRLRSFTQDPAAITRYGALEAEDRSRSFQIESLREAKDAFVARLRGIDDRDAAEALCNVRLYVPRERLPEAGPDEFYHADLIGLAAVLKDGAAFGEVIAVENFGAGDILEIRRTDGTTVMLPFTEIAVPEIDIAGGRIVVDPPTEAKDDEI
jgi:16S rRNA processing protein RimM